MSQPRAGLTKEQKMGFVLLCVLAVLAIGLGAMQIRNTMYAPFALSRKMPILEHKDANTIDAMRFRDTDYDGLSDFDELYVYGTSAYLADSDSDGVADKTEIDKGANPLCDEKKSNCSAAAENPEALPSANIVSSTTGSARNASSSIGEALAGGQDLEKILSDPAQVRKMLISSGIDKKTLDQISDEELMSLVMDTLTATGTAEMVQKAGGQ